MDAERRGLHVDKTLAQNWNLKGGLVFAKPLSWDLDKFEYFPDIRRFDSGTPGSVAAWFLYRL